MTQNNLVSVEAQTEHSMTTGKKETRIFVKMYVDAVKRGLIADMGAENWQTLCVIASFMDEQGNCFPSQDQIAKGLGVRRETANRRIKKLVDYRWQGCPVIVVEQANESGQFSTMKYTLMTDYLRPAVGSPLAITTFKKPHDSELSYEEKVLSRNIPGYSRWVSEVKELADYTCVKCGSTKNVVAHHINNYRDFPDQRTAINNGACLCSRCHSLFHNMFGISGTNEKDFKIFMGGR